jgi:MFS family permease
MIDNSARRLPQFVASLAASGGAFCAGTLLGWSSPAAPRLVDEQQYFPITSDQWSWVTSIYNVGCSISCLIVGFLMNKYGRKWTMIGFVFPFVIGWSLLIWAQNFTMMVVARFILGVAGGAFYIAMPQYTTEIAENDVRGILGSFLQLQISLGVLFVYTIGAYLRVFWMNVICGVCPVIFAGIFVFMPETPFYFITKNREDEARKSLRWLRGASYDISSEIDELKNSLKSQETVTFTAAIKERASISALVIGMGLLFFRHMSCIIPILFYATTIFAVSWNMFMNIGFIVKS